VIYPGREEIMSALAMTTTTTMMMMMMMMMMTVVVVVMVITPARAQVDFETARERMREDWFDPKFTKQFFEPEERFFFEQVGRNVNACFATITVKIKKSM